MKFSEKLAKQRKANNLSQEQLADELGVTRQSVSKWESGDSYPDMAKIMSICKILNCPLNDLLDDGVMGEMPSDESSVKEEKKTNYLEDFLRFVTRSYNMFIHMTWKSRIVMLLELCFIALLLIAIFAILFAGCDYLLSRLIWLLPSVIASPLNQLIEALLMMGSFALGALTFFHLFKIRYLDYYITITDANALEQSEEEPIQENSGSELVPAKHPTIVIRDPKHSSSRFFHFLGKVFRFSCNALLCLFIELPAVFCTIGSAALMAAGIALQGNFFRAAGIAGLGAAVFFGMIVYIGYNFVFRRIQPHKYLVMALLGSLLIGGIGCGLTFASLIELKRIPDQTDLEMVTNTFIIDDYTPGRQDVIHSLGTTEYETDNTLKNSVRLEVTHPKLISVIPYDWNNDMTDSGKGHSFYIGYDELDILQLIVKDIRMGALRSDYDLQDTITTTIHASSELIRDIQGKQ